MAAGLPGAGAGAREVQSHRYAGFEDGDDDEEPAGREALEDDDEDGQHVAAASLVRKLCFLLGFGFG